MDKPVEFMTPRFVGKRFDSVGRFNLRDKNSLGLKSVERTKVLENHDRIAARLDEFKQLKNGWLDGKGIAPDPKKLDWLANAFGDNYPEDLPFPYLYPTAEGGVQVEWSVGKWEITLEVDFDSAHGEWHALHMGNHTEEVKTLNLNVSDDWKWIAAEIARRQRGE
ncbi:MAG: hypothetical protein ACRC46_03140 [Thermoguttaceae bacterium]